jgi:hypothetical protein
MSESSKKAEAEFLKGFSKDDKDRANAAGMSSKKKREALKAAKAEAEKKAQEASKSLYFAVCPDND